MRKLKLPDTIKMVITDFDGVMTDNCVYINDDFSTSRKVNFKDIMGIFLLKKNDVKVAIISGEKNSAIDLFARKFLIEEVHQEIRIKINVLQSIVEKYSLTQNEYLYIGDDVNDLECLNYAKYKITVPHAPKELKKLKGIQITKEDGGQGAFREVVDCLLESKKS